MKKYYIFLIILGVFLITFTDSAYFIIPFVISGLIFISIYRIINASIRKQTRPMDQPLPPTISDEVYSNEHDKAHTYSHPTDDNFYDPTLIDAFRYIDFSNANKTTVTLTNVRKTKQLEETLMFINEGEQVILEMSPSLIANIGVYDRSKTLIGYIPKVRIALLNQLMREQRLIKIQISKITKTFVGYIIQLELTYIA